jgi:hypothetical protein
MMKRIGLGVLGVAVVVAAFVFAGAGGPVPGRLNQGLDAAAWAAPGVSEPTATPTPLVVQPLAASGRYSEAELEELRQTLLDTVDVLEALYPFARVGAGAGAQAESQGRTTAETASALPPLVDRELIKSLTPDELYLMRMALGDDARYKEWKANARALKSLVLMPAADESKADGVGANPEAAQASSATSSTSPWSINIVPAPTPVTTPPPGVEHANHAATNAQTGDLEGPAYFAACPTERYPNAAVLAVLIASFVTREADDFAEAAGCQGTLFIVCAPFGGGTNVPGCLGWGILKGINLATQAVLEGLNYCVGAIDFAEAGWSWELSKLNHAESAMMADNFRQRMNTTENFIHHFRNQELRGRIEENLASPDDNPVASFALPGTVCTLAGYEAFDATDLADQFSPARLANCGLLELAREIVDETQDVVVEANGPDSINNAAAEFAAGEAHYAVGEWRRAYDRYRKAYREAVGPPIQ